jgi:hypothetical protein
MLTLTIEGTAGTEMQVPLTMNSPNLKLRAQGAEIHAAVAGTKDSILVVPFPAGEGWKTITVTLSW